MIETTDPPKSKTPDPARLQAILDRANAGDESVVPALRKVLDDHPDLAAALGDLARHARQSLITLASGRSLLAREAITHQADALRARLLDESSPELERLLTERIAVTWVEVHYCHVDLAGRLQAGAGDDPGTKAAVKRLDRAHARLLSAVKALAVVRKLLRPGVSALDFATKSVTEGPGHTVPARVMARGAMAAAN